MAYERKFEKVDLSDTVLLLDATTPEKAWQNAIHHVKMGVAVTPIMVHRPMYKEENGEKIPVASYDSERIEHGSYVTESGRDGQYYMVMVDRHNDGEWKALTPCSDYYAAVEPSEIYRNLRSMLATTKSHPTYVYNAYNGGSQQLRVRIDDLNGVNVDSISGMHMELVLSTSLDKTANHTLSVVPVTDDGTPILFSDTGRSGFNFKVRHTNKAKTEIVNFNAAVASVVNAWNSKIVPYVQFLSDGDLSENDTLALMHGIVGDAKLPKDITDEITTACKNKIRAGGSGIDVVKYVSKVVDERDVTPMAKHRDADKVGKVIASRVKQLFEKKQRGLQND